MLVPNHLPTSNGPLETCTFSTNCIHGPPSWGSYPGSMTQLTLLPTGRIIPSHHVMQAKGLLSLAPPLQEFFQFSWVCGWCKNRSKDDTPHTICLTPHTWLPRSHEVRKETQGLRAPLLRAHLPTPDGLKEESQDSRVPLMQGDVPWSGTSCTVLPPSCILTSAEPWELSEASLLPASSPQPLLCWKIQTNRKEDCGTRAGQTINICFVKRSPQ